MTRIAVVVFPGSNCDHDMEHVATEMLGAEARMVWHKEIALGPRPDLVVLPGGFSYGDYLRCGAMAARSPIMPAVIEYARAGGPLLGICNGFQVLCEAGLLPGALMRNSSLKFVCRDVRVKVESERSLFTRGLGGRVLRMPVAHGDGNYFAETDELSRLEGEGRVVLRYCEPDGAITDAANPNGALANIAGVCDERGTIMGLMPHPERASEAILGSEDGRRLFEALLG